MKKEIIFNKEIPKKTKEIVLANCTVPLNVYLKFVRRAGYIGYRLLK